MSEEVSQKEEVFDKGKLYQFDGSRFVQVEPSKEIKVPITEEAMMEIQELRKTENCSEINRNATGIVFGCVCNDC